MKRYVEHIKNNRTPHERRQHAMQAAGVVTAALFAVWLGTLGIRLASPQEVADASDQSLTASAAASQAQTGPHLEVSTTSIYAN